jgi:hypothetical protein
MHARVNNDLIELFSFGCCFSVVDRWHSNTLFLILAIDFKTRQFRSYTDKINYEQSGDVD